MSERHHPWCEQVKCDGLMHRSRAVQINSRDGAQPPITVQLAVSTFADAQPLIGILQGDLAVLATIGQARATRQVLGRLIHHASQGVQR